MENAEVWNDVPHYEGLYQISNLGRVWSIKRQIYLKPRWDKDGYNRLALYKNGQVKYEFVHRLVALVYCDKPEGTTVVNHKDENKQNNCADNLEWCTHEYNSNYGTNPQRHSEIMKQIRKTKKWSRITSQ